MPQDKPDTENFDLAESPGHLLHRAQQFAAERFMTAMAGAKLTQRQFAVLHATGKNEGLTQTELVRVTGIDRSTLAELVALRPHLDDPRAQARLEEEVKRLTALAGDSRVVH